MTDSITDTFHFLFGISKDSFELDFWQMSARAVLIYIIAIAIVRMGNKRFMGRNSTFDLLLGIMLGSVLSRGITGQAPIAGCVAAGFVLLLMHWVLGAIAYYLDWFATLIKGRPRVLIRDGKVDKSATARSHFGKEDLAEAMRAHGRTEDPADIRLATLERSGAVSVLLAKQDPKVVEVKVADNVQTIRIEVGR